MTLKIITTRKKFTRISPTSVEFSEGPEEITLSENVEIGDEAALKYLVNEIAQFNQSQSNMIQAIKESGNSYYKITKKISGHLEDPGSAPIIAKHD